MIQFDKLIIKGFGSIIDETDFKLNLPGLNIVIGDNGAGKTTFFSALRWVISEKTLKSIKSPEPWEKIKPKDFTGTFVTLKFTKEDGKRYELHRQKVGKKVTVRLSEKGSKENLLTKGRKIENQAYIYEFLGFNDEILTNSIIFGQKMQRLISASGPDKKKLFEEAFSATFIQQGKDAAKEDLAIETKKLNEVKYDLEVKTLKIQNLERLIQRAKDEHERFQGKLEDQTNTLKAKIKKLTKAIDQAPDIKQLNSKKEAIQQELGELRPKYYEAREKARNNPLPKLNKEHKAKLNYKSQLEDELKDIADRLKGEEKTCAYCGGKIKDIAYRKQIKKLQAQKDDIDQKIYDVEGEIFYLLEKMNNASRTDYDILYNRLGKEIDKLEEALTDLEKQAYSVAHQQSQLKEAKKELAKLRYETPPPMPVKELREKEELEDEVKNLTKLSKKLSKKVENINWVVNDLLSNKGLKSYIFDTMLANLNKLLAYYEQFIGFRVEFNVDIDSANKDIYTVCYQGEHLIYYEELSGGQAQLVDTVTLFALYDLITENNPTNLLVLDEPFESLSTKNVDLMLDLIQDKAKDNKSVFLITHLTEFQNNSGKVIRVALKDGKTVKKLL